MAGAARHDRREQRQARGAQRAHDSSRPNLHDRISRCPDEWERLELKSSGALIREVRARGCSECCDRRSCIRFLRWTVERAIPPKERLPMFKSRSVSRRAVLADAGKLTLSAGAIALLAGKDALAHNADPGKDAGILNAA